MTFGVTYKCDLGIMILGTRNTGAIVNIDLTAKDKKPTAAMIDDLLADVRATGSGRTMLVMHPRVKGMLVREFKDRNVQMRPKDSVIDRDLESWGGVPIVLTYNIDDGKEDKVSLE